VTAIPAVAESVGAHRIVAGRGVAYPFGDPAMAFPAERALRRRIVERALESLRTPVQAPTVFDT
jgi:glycine reductase